MLLHTLYLSMKTFVYVCVHCRMLAAGPTAATFIHGHSAVVGGYCSIVICADIQRVVSHPARRLEARDTGAL